MRRLYIFLFLFFIYYLSSAQNEANNWYFGQGAGVTFNSGSPVALTNGQLYTVEGCSSISDANGNLLFYTDGIRVWNRNHLIMTNGNNLKGNPISSQSGIIVPKPGSTTQFYIFTVDMQAGLAVSYPPDGKYDGLLYSEVDMSLSGGLGSVVAANKNVLVKDTTTENLAAVRHQNGTDYWVVVHGSNDNNYYSYLISAAGVNTTPVISSTGPDVVVSSVTQGTGANGIMKISPDGSKIASTHYGTKDLIISDFDASTGIVNNSISIPIQTTIKSEGPYGIEFSNCNEYLYVTEQLIDTLGGRTWPLESNVWRFDMSAGSIPASQTLFQTLPNEYLGALQLAIDGNIYCARMIRAGTSIVNYGFGYATSLHAINNPRQSTATFTSNAVNLSGRLSAIGLPPFVASFFYNSKIDVTNLETGSETLFCLGDSILFKGTTSAYDSIRWNFDDISSGIYNTSEIKNTSHLYASSGNYQITLIRYLCGQSDTAYKNITVTPYPIMNDIDDIAICSGNDVLLDATASPVSSYLWNTGAITPTITIDTSGKYVIIADNNGCTTKDSMNLTVTTTVTSAVSISASTTNSICQGDNVLFSAIPVAGLPTNGQNFQWYLNDSLLTNDTTNTFFSNTLNDNDTIEVYLTLTNAGSCVVGNTTVTSTFPITVKPVPSISTPGNQSLCYGENTFPVNFTSNLSSTNFNWTNNNTIIGLDSIGFGSIPSFIADNGGFTTQTATITVTPSNNGCTGESESFTFTVNECTLPVELINFDGRKVEDFTNQLFWSTATELNNDYFSLEHSQQLDDFNEIYRVNCYGNSTQKKDYEFYHKNVPEGINYYRLKQVDNDGNYSYSQVVKIQNETKNYLVNIFPNPASYSISVIIKNPIGNSNVIIYNTLGQIMKYQEIKNDAANRTEINISDFANGVYYMTISDNKYKNTLTFLKQ